MGAMLNDSESTPKDHYQNHESIANPFPFPFPAFVVALFPIPQSLFPDFSYRFNDAPDLVLSGVRAAADAHDTVGSDAESLDDGRRVEIAMRHEQAALGECDGHVIRGLAGH